MNENEENILNNSNFKVFYKFYQLSLKKNEFETNKSKSN